MTIQANEKLKFNGKEYGFNQLPLSAVLDALDFKFKPKFTCCRRGYVGNWLVENDRLYLEKCVVDEGNLELEEILGYEFKRLEAKWYSGEIEIQEGKEISFCSIIGATHEFSTFLTFEKGRLIKKREISNVTGEEIILSSQDLFYPRRDGIYLHHYKGSNRFGEYFEMTMLLVFTKDNFVYYEDTDRIIEGEEFNSSFVENDFGDELSKNMGKFIITEKDQINIRLPFSDSKIKFMEDEYQEFNGVVKNDYLVLDYSLRSWSELKEDYVFRKLISEARFDFFKL
ncbi:hypothetical protein [Marinifilum fragile]|uniref:hypothetical protein n=1 Tax=Marinifilum fragile TaxID=570161 RepID=UPI002AA84146|nr:hypothetical protein [Marinifilum fragile]